MRLEEVRQEAACVWDGPREELPFRFADVGDHLDQALSDSSALASVSRAVIDAAARFSCGALAGASPLGQRLAGAAVAIANNGLRIHSPEDPTPAVLMVDGILTTGTQFAWLAQELKEAGVTHTPGVVVVQLVNEDELPASLEEIVLID